MVSSRLYVNTGTLTFFRIDGIRFATLLKTRPMEFFLVIFSTSSAGDSGSESTPATCTTGTNGDKMSIGISSTGVHGTDDSGVVVADDDADGQPSEPEPEPGPSSPWHQSPRMWRLVYARILRLYSEYFLGFSHCTKRRSEYATRKRCEVAHWKRLLGDVAHRRVDVWDDSRLRRPRDEASREVVHIHGGLESADNGDVGVGKRMHQAVREQAVNASQS